MNFENDSKNNFDCRIGVIWHLIAPPVCPGVRVNPFISLLVFRD
jgi:hypothetical protein